MNEKILAAQAALVIAVGAIALTASAGLLAKKDPEPAVAAAPLQAQQSFAEATGSLPFTQPPANFAAQAAKAELEVKAADEGAARDARMREIAREEAQSAVDEAEGYAATAREQAEFRRELARH